MKKIYTILLMISLFVQTFALPPETSYTANTAHKGYYDDASYGPFDIGFSFNFYGNTYTQFYVSSNGLITFGSGSATFTNYCIPSPGNTPNNMICAFWDDLLIDETGAIYYQTIGAAPNRQLIVQWTNMTMYGLPTLMGTFTAILYETSNNIQIQFRSIVDPSSPQPHGSSATIGVENLGGTAAVSYSCNTANAVNTGTALLFTQSGATYTLNSNATYQGVLLAEAAPYPGIPGLVSPANNATVGLSTNFQWTAATDATSYSLQISPNSDLSVPTSYSAGTATNFTPPDFSTGATEYWAVWATNSSGTTWSEIRKLTTSANPPLAAVPQTYYVELTQDVSIQISYTGGDANSKTAIITSLPTDGALYQYNNGVRGAQITTVPTTLTDASMRLIYAASGTSGNGKGNFNAKVHDGTGDSPEITTTVNVSPLGAPNFLRAAKSINTIEIQFDRLMADPTGKQAQFTVTDGSGAVSVTSAALKTGDNYTIVLTMGRTLTGTVNLTYTAGTIASQVGGLLLSFSSQIVSLTLQTISFNALSAKNYGDAAFALTASASSGLAVTYSSSNTSVATVSGSTCTLTGAGTTTITATQTGDGTYAPVTYSQVLTVNSKALTVTGASVTSKTYDGTNIAIITGATLSGVVGSDVVTLGNAISGTFTSASVGSGKTVTTTMTISGATSGNYTLTQPALTGTITAKALTVTGASVTSKTYDGTTSATITGATLSGVVGSDVVTLGSATSGTFASASVGSGKTVIPTMTISGATSGNYTLTQPVLTGTITAKALIVTGASVTSKTYDGTNVATITGATLSGVLGSDVVTLVNTTSGTFASASVGSGKTVTPTMTISGANADNYTLTQPALTGTITAKALTVTGASVTSKTYDGTNVATITGASLSGVVGSDVVTLGSATSGTFASTTVGTDITVTTSMVISGANSGNYTITQPALIGNITPLALTITGATANNKVYDGTTDAVVIGATLDGIVGSDNIELQNVTAGIFDQSAVGTHINVTTAMSLSGADIGNYTLSQPTLSADITALALTITGATADNKEYDGTSAATISGGTLAGVVGSDDVTLATATAGTFASSIAGIGISVTPAMTLTGASVDNYTLTQPTLAADITALALTVTGAIADNKVYDGTTAATISGGTLVGVVGSDDVTLATSTAGTFASSNIGIGISVTPAMTLTGTSVGNYTLTQPALAADITALALTVTGATADNKEYDGTTAATISGGTLVGVVGSDDVTLATATSGTFASSNVGIGISVTPALTLTGNDAGNYTLTQPSSLMADITVKTLTVTADNKSKIYGDVNPAFTIAYNGFAGSEDVTALTTVPTATSTATQFSDVNTYDIVPAGGAASNYTFGYVNGKFTVNKADLDVTADNTSRKKGDPNPAFTLSYAGFKGTDDASVIDVLPTATCTADASSAAGDYSILLAGGSDNNYNLLLHNGTLTVSPATAISTAQALAVSAYPNPASDYIYINNLTEKTAIAIFSLQGKLMKNCISTNTIEKIDINNFPSGVYFIKLTGKEVDTVIRFVKR